MTTFEIGCHEPPYYDCHKAVQIVSEIERQDTYYEKN